MASRFNKKLEEKHQAELGTEKIRITRITIFLAISLNMAYALLDLWALSSAIFTAWTIRSITILSLLPLFALTWHRWFLRYYVLWMVLLFSMLGVAVNALIYIASADDLARDVYYSGLMLITMGIYSLTYIKLWQSFTIASSLVIAYLFIAIVAHDYTRPDNLPTLVSNLFFFISMVLIGAVGQSVRDRYARDNFLLRHLLERDVRVHAEDARQARWLAGHDSLTGLPNRLQLEKAATKLLENARRSHQQVAVIYVDLDNFKPVNDQHGHETGDRVLAIIATRLSDFIEGKGLVARVGGDEFVIALTIKDHSLYHSLPATIARSVARPIEVRGDQLSMSASVGITSFPDEGESLDELMSAADQDMYRAKHGNRKKRSVDPE